MCVWFIWQRVINWLTFVLQTWNPKSKSEPYAQSAVELMKLAKETADNFFEIPIGITEDLVLDLADGLETHFQEYATFVASCGKNDMLIIIFFWENYIFYIL